MRNRPKSYLFLSSLALAFLAGCSTTSATSSGTSFETENTISGRVVDSAGHPLALARVQVRPYWYVRDGADADTNAEVGIVDAVSDSTGLFSVSGIPGGSYRLLIQGSGLSALVAESLDNVRRVVSVGTVAAQTPARISGSVALQAGEGPSTIQVYGAEIQAVSASDGSFQISDVPHGALRIRAISGLTGHILAESLVVAPSGSKVAVNTMKPGSEDLLTWRYGQSISIDPASGGLSGQGTIRDLPVLVRMDAGLFPVKAAGDGSDIRVRDPVTGLAVPFELETWDPTRSTCNLWIHLDSLVTSASARILEVRWGRPGAGSISRSTAVFDTAAGWSGVWHLSTAFQDASGRLVTPDATANEQNGVVQGTGGQANGVVGPGWSFDGATDAIRMGGGSTELGKRSWTMEMWVRPDRIGATMLAKGTGFTETGMKELGLRGGAGAGRHVPGWDPSLSVYGTYANYASGQSAFASGAWSHFAVRWSLSTGDSVQVDWFEDGKLLGGTTRFGYTSDTPGDSLTLGEDVSGTVDSLRLQGALDEVRILGEARSDAWILASHAAQAPGGALVSFQSRW